MRRSTALIRTATCRVARGLREDTGEQLTVRQLAQRVGRLWGPAALPPNPAGASRIACMGAELAARQLRAAAHRRAPEHR